MGMNENFRNHGNEDVRPFLNERQNEVYGLHMLGIDDQTLADLLSIKLNTIHCHLGDIRELLNFESRLKMAVAHFKYFETKGDDSMYDRLSPAERKVFALLVEGYSQEETALALHRAVGTIRATMRNIYAKFNCPSATRLVFKYYLGDNKI